MAKTKRPVWRCPICKTTLTIPPLPLAERGERAPEQTADLSLLTLHLVNHGSLELVGALLDYWRILYLITNLIERAEKASAGPIDLQPDQPYVYVYQLKEALGVAA